MKKWLYDKDGNGKIFDGEHPEGWFDHPDDAKTVAVKKEPEKEFDNAIPKKKTVKKKKV